MIRVTIPLIDEELVILSGPTEWKKFCKLTSEAGADVSGEGDAPGEGSGRQWGGWIWVHDLGDRKLMLHELSHFMDTLMEHLNTEDGEFRAFLSSDVYDRSLSAIERGRS